MKVTLTVLSLLCLVATANAAITVAVDPGVDVGGGLKLYVVRLVSDVPGDKVTAWDGTFTGPMNQLKAFGFFDTPTMTMAVALGADINKDSHFLMNDADLAIARSPNETGTKLDGAIGFKSSIAAENLALAQIVLAPGAVVEMRGQGANAQGAKSPTNATIPEPATLTLLGLGAAALIRRRMA